MAKIPFSIDYRPQIESGEYKVETFSGYPVTIYRWDFDDGAQTPIMGSYVFEDGKEYVGAWDDDGHFDLMSPNDLDLFLITPGPEFTEFEKSLWKIMKFEGSPIGPMDKFTQDDERVFHAYSSQLLELARKEIGQKVLTDKVFLSKTYVDAYDAGREDALKDLPRWRKWENGACGNGRGTPIAIVKRWNNDYILVDALGIQGEQYIMLSDLEKLPGFKED